ncbi:MAG TPA: rod shape-determining protein MreD [Candidatus Sulfotelmatobacter sp.]|jgi:rod shape-determining protein MreD|nr:rod shape-determining protein MreD [Candidatus Sulfotelmatobacter sp.]
MNASVSLTSREEIEVHRFSWPVSLGIPLLAVFLQVFLRIGLLNILDLPLLVTIFFAVARRRPIPGLMTGALIGTLQDAWTGHPIGLFGIAKTIVGYLGSSLGVKLDVDNPGSRFLMTFAFVLIHKFMYMAIDLLLVGGSEAWNWAHTLVGALVNSLAAVVLFAALDKLKLRN